MSYSLLVRPEAQADLAETQKWYEERATGLSRQFVEAVDDTLVSISNSPLAYPTVRNVVRRALTKRFPYGVLFLVEAETVVVFWQFSTKPVIQSCGRGGPNPRLQRTRMRAPLSRKPLGALRG